MRGLASELHTHTEPNGNSTPSFISGSRFLFRSQARLVAASVERVGDAVGIVVHLRTAVAVLEAIAIFGPVGALVAIVGQAVLVRVFGAGCETYPQRRAKRRIADAVEERQLAPRAARHRRREAARRGSRSSQPEACSSFGARVERHVAAPLEEQGAAVVRVDAQIFQVQREAEPHRELVAEARRARVDRRAAGIGASVRSQLRACVGVDRDDARVHLREEARQTGYAAFTEEAGSSPRGA